MLYTERDGERPSARGLLLLGHRRDGLRGHVGRTRGVCSADPSGNLTESRAEREPSHRLALPPIPRGGRVHGEH
jgi:hypothetical protein